MNKRAKGAVAGAAMVVAGGNGVYIDNLNDTIETQEVVIAQTNEKLSETHRDKVYLKRIVNDVMKDEYKKQYAYEDVQKELKEGCEQTFKPGTDEVRISVKDNKSIYSFCLQQGEYTIIADKNVL